MNASNAKRLKRFRKEFYAALFERQQKDSEPHIDTSMLSDVGLVALLLTLIPFFFYSHSIRVYVVGLSSGWAFFFFLVLLLSVKYKPVNEDGEDEAYRKMSPDTLQDCVFTQPFMWSAAAVLAVLWFLMWSLILR